MKKLNNGQRVEKRTILFFGKEKFIDVFPIEIRSVDAWRDECGWSYNNSFPILKNEKLMLPSSITNRNLLKFLRDWDVLSEASKGRVLVNDQHWPFVEIQLKGTFEPIIQIIFDEEHQYKMVL